MLRQGVIVRGWRSLFTLIMVALLVAAIVLARRDATPVPRAIDTGLTGTLVAVLAPGGNWSFGAVAEIDLATLDARPTSLMVNSISGSQDNVIAVHGAPATLARYVDGRYEPFPNLNLEFTDVAELSPDGRLAFSHQVRASPEAGDEVWVWDTRRGKGRKMWTLADTFTVRGLVWKDERSLLVLSAQDRGGRFEILRFRDEGLVARIPVGMRGGMLDGPGSTVLLADDVGTYEDPSVVAEVFDLRTRAVARIEGGWIPLVLSPDRTQFLMVRYAPGPTPARSFIGLADAARPTSIREIGSIEGGLGVGVWRAAA